VGTAAPPTAGGCYAGILTTLCGGLVLIAGWQYRHRLAGVLGLLMVLLPWFFDSKLQAMLNYALNA
jgi:hypothetical protein